LIGVPLSNGSSISQIANELGISTTSVSKHLTKLRDELEHVAESDDIPR
jgi:predicted ArsR family transcriptional regulator